MTKRGASEHAGLAAGVGSALSGAWTALQMSADRVNGSKLFAALVLVLMNTVGRVVPIHSPALEGLIKSAFTRSSVLFAVLWLATRDVLLSLVLTGLFGFFFEHLVEPSSPYCVVPPGWVELEAAADLNGDGELSPDEILRAKELLERARRAQEANFQQRAFLTAAAVAQ